MSWRMERIGEQVRGELARLLRDEVSDPRIGLVTLTRVDVSPDLATASVFWSRLAPDDRQDAAEASPSPAEAIAEVERGLRSAAGFLRGRLARELSLRRTPELRFRHDPSIALGTETLTLIRKLSEERVQREGSADEPVEESGEGNGAEPAVRASQRHDGALHEAPKKERD